jgi:hypothetical protein
VPLAVRMGTSSAEAAYTRLREAGVTLHYEGVVQMERAPPMFFFSDPDGNGLVYVEERAPTTEDVSDV